MKVFLFDRIKNISVALLTFQVIICVIGGLVVFSTTYSEEKIVSQIFINQIIFYILGISVAILFAGFDYRVILKKTVIASIFLTTLVFLIAVLFYGDIIFGARRWLSIGGFTLQPSEFAKLCVVILTGFAFSADTFNEKKEIVDLRAETKYKSFKLFFYSAIKKLSFTRHSLVFMLTMLIIVLVFLQKSLGNTLLIFGIYILLYLSVFKISKKNILYLVAAVFGLVISFKIIDLSDIYSQIGINVYLGGLDFVQIFSVIILLYIINIFIKSRYLVLIMIFFTFLFSFFFASFSYNNILEDYQRGRIESFLNLSDTNSLNENWNKEQSQTAIGSGQFVGKGFLKGTQVTFGLLPFPHTDFSYAAFAEQFGFIGSIVLLLLYLMLLLKIIFISLNADDNFGKIICLGVFLMIILNMFQAIGMNLGILPISGVPLPLISYGGSAVFSVSLGLGLVQSVNTISKEKSSVVIKVDV